MKAALYRYAQQGQSVSYLDVQDEDNLARFYQNLLTALLTHLPVTLKDQLSTALGGALKLPDSLSRWVRQQISKVSIPDVLEIELQPQQEQLLRYWKPLTDQIATHKRSQKSLLEQILTTSPGTSAKLPATVSPKPMVRQFGLSLTPLWRKYLPTKQRPSSNLAMQ